MAILAQKAALRIAASAFRAVVMVVPDELISFAMQFELAVAIFLPGCVVFRFYQAEKGNPDPLAPVMAGDTSFGRDT